MGLNRFGDSQWSGNVIHDAGWAGGQHGMPKPYSNDLRERVVDAVERDGLSRNQAAARFGVAVSTAINWVARYRATGSFAPGQMGGHKPKAIRDAHRDWLIERCKKQDFTLMGLV